MVEQWNNHDGRVDYFNNSKISDGWTVEHLMMEQWNRDGGTAGGGKVEQWISPKRLMLFSIHSSFRN